MEIASGRAFSHPRVTFLTERRPRGAGSRGARAPEIGGRIVMRTAFGVLACALGHFAAVFVLATWAGLTASAPLTIAADILSFPLSLLLPAGRAPHGTDWLLIALTSLVWGAAIFVLIKATIGKFGAPGAVGLAALAGIGVVGALAAAGFFSAAKPMDLVEQRLAGRTLRMPAAFTTVTNDSGLEAAQTDAAGGDAGLRVERAYMNYRPAASGEADYDAVVIAAPAALFATAEDFEREVSYQTNATWRDARWSLESTAEGAVVEAGASDIAPRTGPSRNRLIRIRATAPTDGIWLALVADERAIPRAEAEAIFAAMRASLGGA